MAGSSQRRAATRLKPEVRMADIMRVARDIFRERDYEDVLISEIAERAQVVEGTLYRYFESKRDLLVKVAEAWFEEMLADFDVQLVGVRGTRNRLRFMIWKHLATIEREPALCRIVFRELRSGADYRGTTVFQLNREYTRRTMSIIDDGIAAGEFRAGLSLPLVRDMIYGCVEHHTWAYLRGQGKLTPAATADAITDLLFQGIAVQEYPLSSNRRDATLDRLDQLVDRIERATKPRGR